MPPDSYRVLKDCHGQPIQLFRLNFENNVSKAIDQLSGLCAGILADGVVNDAEAKLFADWVRKFGKHEPVWPFTDILARINRIFADGRCDDEEREELKSIMEAVCGHTDTSNRVESYSSALPFDTPLPENITFLDQDISITGRFAFGTRKKVLETIEALGGRPSDAAPTRQTRYLVIGTFASRDWYNTNYGRKIERAVELKGEGTGISIISEEHWKRFLPTPGKGI